MFIIYMIIAVGCIISFIHSLWNIAEYSEKTFTSPLDDIKNSDDFYNRFGK